MMHRFKRSGFIAITMMMIWVLLMGALPTSADNTITLTTYSVTNVRSGPSTSTSVIGRLMPNETVTANGRSSTSNEWLRIDPNGSEGWISGSVVTLNGDPTTLSIVAASAAETTTGNTGVTATLNGNASIRLGPGTSYPILDSAAAETQFDVTGHNAFDARVVCFGSNIINVLTQETPENVWLRINFNGFEGWVSLQVVSVSGNVCDLPEVGFEDTDFDTDFADMRGVLVVTTSSVNLRASNYRNSEVLAVIPFDTALQADARDSDSNRVRVTYGDETGWISILYVTIAAGNVDNLPVEQE